MRFLLLTLFLSGCAYTQTTPMKADIDAKDDDCELDTFVEGESIPHPFDIACLIETKSGTSGFENKSTAHQIRRGEVQACRCGADALVVYGGGIEGNGWNSGYRGAAYMKAIRYKDGHHKPASIPTPIATEPEAVSSPVPEMSSVGRAWRNIFP